MSGYWILTDCAVQFAPPYQWVKMGLKHLNGLISLIAMPVRDIGSFKPIGKQMVGHLNTNPIFKWPTICLPDTNLSVFLIFPVDLDYNKKLNTGIINFVQKLKESGF